MTRTKKSSLAEEKFGFDISMLLEPNNSSGTSLLRFIRKLAKRYQIKDIDLFNILFQVTLLGFEQIQETGQEISNPVAWLRVQILAIFRNQVQANVLQESLPSELRIIKQIICHVPTSQLELEDQLTQFAEACKTLSVQEQEILKLYLEEDKDYKEIRSYYQGKNNDSTNLSTIRKLVCHAKECAIKVYHQIDVPENLI